MQHMRKATIATALAMALLGAACSGDAESSGNTTETDSQTTAADAAAGNEDATPDSTDGDPYGDLVAAAEQEGALTFYASSSPGILDVMIPAFEEDFDISVELLRLNSGDLTQRYLAEAESSEADVIEVPGILFATSPELFVEMSEEEVPGYQAYPEAAREASHSIVSYLSPWTIMYNTDMVSEDEVPTTWEEVVNEWDGQYILTDPRSSNSYMGWSHETAEEVGVDLLEQIGSQNPTLSQGGAAAAQQVAAGEFAISIPNYPGQALPLASEGAPIAYNVPSEPAAVLAMSIGIPSNAPNPNAARLFTAWRMTAEAQQMVCDSGLSAAPLWASGDIEECEVTIPEDWRTYEEDLSDERQAELLDALGIAE